MDVGVIQKEHAKASLLEIVCEMVPDACLVITEVLIALNRIVEWFVEVVLVVEAEVQVAALPSNHRGDGDAVVAQYMSFLIVVL